MFRYLPQSGASPLWPVLFVWVLLNSCCGELKYANFSEINSNYSLPPARVWNLTIAYSPLNNVVLICHACMQKNNERVHCVHMCFVVM